MGHVHVHVTTELSKAIVHKCFLNQHDATAYTVAMSKTVVIGVGLVRHSWLCRGRGSGVHA